MFMLNDSYRYSVVLFSLLLYKYHFNSIIKKNTCIYNDNIFKGYGYFLWLTIFCFYFTLTLIVILFYQNGFYYTHRIFHWFYLITHYNDLDRKKNDLLTRYIAGYISDYNYMVNIAYIVSQKYHPLIPILRYYYLLGILNFRFQILILLYY